MLNYVILDTSFRKSWDGKWKLYNLVKITFSSDSEAFVFHCYCGLEGLAVNAQDEDAAWKI